MSVVLAVAIVSLTVYSSAEEARRRLQEALTDPVTRHKVLFPMDSSDWIGISCAVLGLMIAAGGGIGGGGMLVPIYVLVMGFEPKFAIPLSNFTVLGGAITNVSMNAMKRHPNADRPLVDWDLLILMEPLTLAGALVGGFVNKLAPELLITVLLVVLLALTSDRTLKKGIKLYRKETEARNAQLADLAVVAADDEKKSESEALLSEEDVEKAPGSKSTTKKKPEELAELVAIVEEERQTAPLWKVGVLMGMFTLIVAMNLAKGGGAFPSPLGIECGSTSFWLSTLLMFLSLVAIALGVRDYLVRRTHDKDRLGYDYVEGDFHWDASATLKYPSICFFAGMCAGLFGIGGGIVNGPLMLELGVLPAVASATTACMILLTSTTAATTFVVFGLVQMDYATRLFWVGVSATAVGQLGMSWLIKKSGRPSYVAFSIGAVVSLSCVLMGIHGLFSLAYNAEEEEHHSGGICATGD